MPTTQPTKSTSTKITNRPTQGDTLGSASKPPRCGSTTRPNLHAAQIATTQTTSDTASRTNPRNTPIKVELNRTNRIKTSAPVITAVYPCAQSTGARPVLP